MQNPPIFHILGNCKKFQHTKFQEIIDFIILWLIRMKWYRVFPLKANYDGHSVSAFNTIKWGSGKVILNKNKKSYLYTLLMFIGLLIIFWQLITVK